MTIELNHTIVNAVDKQISATFLAEILGLAPPEKVGPFLVVQVDNGVSLDFYEDAGRPVEHQHYAFLVDESSFEEIFERIRDRGLTYWADPMHQRPGEVDTRGGGRGLYWADPSGHNLEILTQPLAST